MEKTEIVNSDVPSFYKTKQRCLAVKETVLKHPKQIIVATAILATIGLTGVGMEILDNLKYYPITKSDTVEDWRLETQHVSIPQGVCAEFRFSDNHRVKTTRCAVLQKEEFDIVLSNNTSLEVRIWGEKRTNIGPANETLDPCIYLETEKRPWVSLPPENNCFCDNCG